MLYDRIISKNLVHVQKDKLPVILDVGCGNGDFVARMSRLGFLCYGIDIEFKQGQYLDELLSNGKIKLIDTGIENRRSLTSGARYIWPKFESDIDVVCSRAVLEHVFNLDEFIINSKMVIGKRNGIHIHYFPSKYSIIEPHTGIPFGAIFQNKLYFMVCCYVGFCFKKFRFRGQSAYDYVKQYTCYRSRLEIDENFIKHGYRVLKSRSPLNCHKRTLLKLSSKIKIIDKFFRLFRSDVSVYSLDSNTQIENLQNN